MFRQNLWRFALTQRGHIKRVPGEAGHGGAWDRELPFPQQLAGWAEAVDAAGRWACRPVIPLHIRCGAVRTAVFVGQRRQDAAVRAAASGWIEIPDLDD